MNLNNFKKLFINGTELKQLFINGVQVWKSFTNQVPISTDTDGSIFNGVGYKENVRLSSSGGISSSAQNGSVTTGFIPWYGDTTVLRLRGVEWLNAFVKYGGHHYFSFYDSNKKLMVYVSSHNYNGGSWSHVMTVTRDNNDVETVVFNTEYGNTNSFLNGVRQASFVRITAHGKGADFIVTINEEIA